MLVRAKNKMMTTNTSKDSLILMIQKYRLKSKALQRMRFPRFFQDSSVYLCEVLFRIRSIKTKRAVITKLDGKRRETNHVRVTNSLFDNS